MEPKEEKKPKLYLFEVAIVENGDEPKVLMDPKGIMARDAEHAKILGLAQYVTTNPMGGPNGFNPDQAEVLVRSFR